MESQFTRLQFPSNGTNGVASVSHAEQANPAEAPAQTHILVPVRVDGSDEDWRMAIEMAASLRPGARITLLHVLPPLTNAPDRSFHWLDAIERLHKPNGHVKVNDIEKTRQTLAARLETILPTTRRALMTLTTECRIGEPAAEIARFANEQSVDLVVLCERRSRWRWPLWPRLSERVLRMTDRPVMLVDPLSKPTHALASC